MIPWATRVDGRIVRNSSSTVIAKLGISNDGKMCEKEYISIITETDGQHWKLVTINKYNTGVCMIKLDFEFETQYGVFRDALYLPEDHSYTEEQITEMKTERLNNWLFTVENPPEPEIIEADDG